MGLGVAGSVALGSAVIGAGASVYGSSQAAGAAGKSASLNEQNLMYNAQSQMPFELAGQGALSSLSSLSQSGSNGPGGTNYLQMAQDALPGQMTQAQLEKTPGYQFQLGQGLAATQNSAAARGLGVSGSALKGAATFATGLADSNYQTQFNNAQTRSQDYLNLNTGQQGNAMNRYTQLLNTATMGANASQGASTNATASTNAAGNYLNQQGQAQAAGTVGVGNAATGAANNYLTYNALQQQTAQNATGAFGQNTIGLFGGGGTPTAAQTSSMASAYG